MIGIRRPMPYSDLASLVETIVNPPEGALRYEVFLSYLKERRTS